MLGKRKKRGTEGLIEDIQGELAELSRHCSDQELKNYARGKLSELQQDRVEGHARSCDYCQHRLRLSIEIYGADTQ